MTTRNMYLPTYVRYVVGHTDFAIPCQSGLDFPNRYIARSSIQYVDTLSNMGLQAFHDTAAAGRDVPTCQALGKKVILSMGGAAGVYGFTSAAVAQRYP
jgi:hypothetical protein